MVKFKLTMSSLAVNYDSETYQTRVESGKTRLYPPVEARPGETAVDRFHWSHVSKPEQGCHGLQILFVDKQRNYCGDDKVSNNSQNRNYA